MIRANGQNIYIRNCLICGRLCLYLFRSSFFWSWCRVRVFFLFENAMCIKIVISGAKEYARVHRVLSYFCIMIDVALPPPSSLWPRVLFFFYIHGLFGVRFFLFIPSSSFNSHCFDQIFVVVLL